MPSSIPSLWWGVTLIALIGAAFVPLGDYLSRRHAAADPWNPT